MPLLQKKLLASNLLTLDRAVYVLICTDRLQHLVDVDVADNPCCSTAGAKAGLQPCLAELPSSACTLRKRLFPAKAAVVLWQGLRAELPCDHVPVVTGVLLGV